jgi:predicted metal-dependent HD superfamily phosphohydrolase
MLEHIYVLKKYYSDKKINEILKRWTEPHRYWHNTDHLKYLLFKIDKLNSINEMEYDILVISAFFHDIIYNPERQNNEIKSIELFNKYSVDLPTNYASSVIKIIKNSANYHNIPLDKLSVMFWVMDNDPIINKDFEKFKDYEYKIRKEYGFVPTPTYKRERLKFLSKYIDLVDDEVDKFIKKCMDYILKKY